MGKLIKKREGITLIALVVTIVILLILASISIGALTGDNGIIDQSHTAKEDTEIASWEEQIDLAIIDAEKKHRNPSLDDVKEELKNKGVINDYSQVDKDGVITTNEPVYEIAGKLDDYVPFGPGKFATKNETYIDENGDTATIPKGFEILEGEDIVDDGLVIQDEEGNQFVWIPVETPVSDTEANGTKNKAMAVKVGENYRGLLYSFNSDYTSTVRSGCTTTTSGYREPDVVTDFDTSNYSSAGYSSLDEMKQGLQSEYDKMILSVKKYYGFYIGRYELGLDESNNPTSKKAENGIITADASNSETEMWYGLYIKCKEYALEEETKSVVSSMTWGSQYDAMLNWMQKNGINVNVIADDINTVRNNFEITGKQEKDLIKNIFDIYGCHSEWTLGVSGASSRIQRSGDYSIVSNKPSSFYVGNGSYPTYNYKTNSTRLTLYVK